MKHIHRWQFGGEVDGMSLMNCRTGEVTFNRNTYLVFVCECGRIKRVVKKIGD